MKLTKTQIAVIAVISGKAKSTPYSCNHEYKAICALRDKGLITGYGFCDAKLTEEGKKTA